MTVPTKDDIQKHCRHALGRCLDAFSGISDKDWGKKSTKVWTARDYLGHLTSSLEAEGIPLTRQALAGESGHLDGFRGREAIDDYNDRILAAVRDLPAPDLLERFRRAHEEHLALLAGLTEADLGKPASNPGWDRAGTVRDLFFMCYLHLPGHYQDIRRAVKRLPHWIDASAPDEVHFQMDRLFHFMPLIYWPDRGGDLHASYLFTLDGDGGGQWTLEIADGKTEARPGATESADLEMRMRPALWMDLSTHDVNPAWAVVSRKVHLIGNASLAMKLESLFRVT
ncbi:MAG: SCP2 sterol-binding domain-containing protein [Chloroflexi bacterium]|nr:SCP2 sterol-binding domain-containing protein [Chloroflexota bacterium]